ncbi:hypothetical protein ACKKBG_A24885 [Auxenochlorella protothecoides x Auxenochlorella symbiontica]
MGKGGPMAFLNKKTWHPGRVQNMEEVWKREQVASKEEQKVRDLQKQIAEERAREELHSMAQAAGVKVRNDRLDWMYQGGVMAKKEADSRVATQGVGPGDDPGVQASSQGEPAQDAAPVSLPAFYSNDTPASANEMWQRLHADPLFAIKHQEQSARRSILANPVQMQAIKAQVRQLKPEHGKDKKKEKKEKKKKKHKRNRESEDEAEERREVEDARHPAQSPGAPQPWRGEGVPDRPRREGAGERRRYSRSRSPVRGRRPRSRSPGPDSAHRSLQQAGQRRSRSPRRERRRRSRSPSRERRQRSRSPSGERRRRSSSPSRARQQRSPSPRRARQQRSPSPAERRPASTHIGGHGGTGPPAHRDAASAQAQGTRYGLNYLRQEVEDEERSARAEATQRHLAEAARRREEEERAAAATRGQRAMYRPGRLSAEEQAARLSAMAHAAEAHEDERVVRVRSQTAREAAEEREAGLRAAGTTASFLESAQKGVYGAEGGSGASGNGSLAEAVNRRKHFNQRGSAAGGAAFRR